MIATTSLSPSRPRAVARLTGLALLAVSVAVGAASRPGPPSDSDLSRAMVGSWVIDPRDPAFEDGPGGISTYQSDGTLDFKGFDDRGCSGPGYRTRARWGIRGGNLVIEVTASERPNLHRPGTVIVDKVRRIDSRGAVLESGRGVLQYRRRQATCVEQP